MPPKGKRTKAEEALDFLSNLDNLDETPDASAAKPSDAPATGGPKPTMPSGSGSTPRQSTDSTRPPRSDTPGTSAAGTGSVAGAGVEAGRKSVEIKSEEDEEAAKALAYLEAQINTKRQPLTVPQSRSTTPSTNIPTKSEDTPTNIPSASATASTSSSTTEQGQGQGGWGSSWWSTATSAIQSAQKIADEQYKKVKTEGVGGVTGQLEHLNVKGVDLGKLRKEAEERFGGIVKNVDLEKLRKSLSLQPLK